MSRKRRSRKPEAFPRKPQRKPDPQANTPVPGNPATSGINHEYRCGNCRQTTRIPAIRIPITILGTRVGEPGHLSSCPSCGQGNPVLVIPPRSPGNGDRRNRES